MSAPLLVAIGLLGGAEALARQPSPPPSPPARHPFPLGFLLVTLGGAFALRLLVGATVHGGASRLVAAGLLGSYTTFGA